MSEVYAKSVFMIFAAWGDSSDSSLGVSRDGSSIKAIRLDICLRETESHLYRAGLLGNQYPPSVATCTLPLFDREWVLQEEVSPSRGLIFGNTKMTWTCMESDACEARPVPEPDSVWFKRKHTTFSKLRPLRRLLRGSSDSIENFFKQWHELVQYHSQRQLTMQEDVISVIAGVANVLSNRYGHTFITGLWTDDLAHGLTWGVKHDTIAEHGAQRPSVWTTSDSFDDHPLLLATTS